VTVPNQTSPNETSRRPPAIGLAVGDRRGLTATGGVLVTLVLGLAGGAVDVLTGPGLREVFAVAFVLGCLLTALTVHREDLFASVVMPPLVYAVLGLFAVLADRTGGAGSFVVRQAVELVNALVLGAPVLVIGTAAAALVATARWLSGRR
jgi:uncharacterized membrane protein YjjP (DUF1212 family)